MRKAFRRICAVIAFVMAFSAADVSAALPVVPQIETVSAITVSFFVFILRGNPQVLASGAVSSLFSTMMSTPSQLR